jgi:RNA polymerase sigma-70 factor, ECF subfamily
LQQTPCRRRSPCVMTSVGQPLADAGAQRDEVDEEFRSHYPWLVRRLALVVGDVEEAADLAQDVFVRAMERWPVNDGGPVRPWLAVVGTRLAISENRRRKRWGFLPVREETEGWALEADPDLWAALAKLDRRTRAALILTVLDGFTQDEVAAAFGVPRGTVASWLSRGRQQLRPILEASRPGHG